jgi:hypothetical protein
MMPLQYQGPSDRHDWPPAAAAAAQLSADAIDTTGGVAASPLRAGPPGRCAATTVLGLQRTLPRDGREDRQGVDAPPEMTLLDTEPAKPPRRGRPVAQAPPVRTPPPSQRGRPRQVTFSIPLTPPPTSATTSASGRPLCNARLPNLLNL